MTENSKIRTVVLKGLMHFSGHPASTFKGPIKRGLRPIAWLNQSNDTATSCSILSDIELQVGDTKEVEIALLNELQLGQPIVIGMVLSIGTTQFKLADFTIEEHLGRWEGGKIP